jgi:GAF domain-containing protein
MEVKQPVRLRSRMQSRPEILSPPDEIVDHFELVLRNQGLFEALRYLNSTTEHRFTGIYRFEQDWVRSVLLFDRGNPHLRAGADVRMKESYCMLAGRSQETFCIEDAQADPRLLEHAARGTVLCYCAVKLLSLEGHPWGTLCHFDFRPCQIAAETIQALEAVRPLVERALQGREGTPQGQEASMPLLSR